MNLFILLIISLIPMLHFATTTSSSTTKYSPKYSTKSHILQVTEALKPKCHPFNILCVPCKLSINVIRSAMKRIIFVHQAVENICIAILYQHAICDAIISAGMFYIDHTPTEKLCKRFFLCGNTGFFDWWSKDEAITNLNFLNSTVLEILNTPIEREKINIAKYSEVHRILHSLLDDSGVQSEDIPKEFDLRLAEFLTSLEKAANFLIHHNNQQNFIPDTHMKN